MTFYQELQLDQVGSKSYIATLKKSESTSQSTYLKFY